MRGGKANGIRDKIYGALFGVAIGDALGVPAEFNDRDFLRANPISGFEGYKSHNQPPGTFSDDSSLTFCLAESLCHGYNLRDLADRFMRWREEAYWTAGGEVFDIGMTTDRAIGRLKKGIRPDLAGDFDEENNGNGSLMRILPLLFYIRNFDEEERYERVREVSSLTHGHIRSVLACFYYLELGLRLLHGKDKWTAYAETSAIVRKCISDKDIVQKERELFSDLLDGNIGKQEVHTIPTFGYVMNTLKASIWCFLNTHTYKDAVLGAVNLGNDSDTTAAVTGGLAGLYYGYETIPKEWRKGIRRSPDIEDLCEKFFISLSADLF